MIIITIATYKSCYNYRNTASRICAYFICTKIYSSTRHHCPHSICYCCCSDYRSSRAVCKCSCSSIYISRTTYPWVLCIESTSWCRHCDSYCTCVEICYIISISCNLSIYSCRSSSISITPSWVYISCIWYGCYGCSCSIVIYYLSRGSWNSTTSRPSVRQCI